MLVTNLNWHSVALNHIAVTREKLFENTRRQFIHPQNQQEELINIEWDSRQYSEIHCDVTHARHTSHIPSVRFNANSTNDISIWLPWFCVSVGGGGGGSWYKTSGEAQNRCGCADRSLCYRTNEVRELFFSLYFQCCRQLINANTLDFISSFALCWIHSCVAICPVRWPKTHISRIVEAFSCVALA